MFHQHHHFLQRRLGRIVAGTALTVAMSIASPAGLWQWLEGVLADRTGAVIRERAPSPRAAAQSPAARPKELVCPPAGCPTTPGTTQGGGTDPDGRHP